MNTLQEALLKMFKDVQGILETNNIKYTAIGGTAIGALRESGFIPWDDDIDIAIHEDQKEEFINVIEKSRFVFETNIDRQKTIFIKIYDPAIEIIERGQLSSLFIDVFILYRKRENQEKIIKKNNKLQILADSKYLKLKRIMHTESAISSFFAKVYGYMIFWMNNIKIQKIQQNRIENAKIISNETFSFEGESIGYKRRIDNLVKVKFEDTHIFVSKTYAKDSFTEHGDIFLIPEDNEKINHDIYLKDYLEKCTVIIPTHNRYNHFKRQVEFFKNNNQFNVIYIENNSSSLNIKKYDNLILSKNQKIIHIKTKDVAISQARNLGIEMAKTEMIFFLDDDDFMNHKFVKWLSSIKYSYKYNVARFNIYTGKRKHRPGFARYINKLSKFNVVQVSSYLFKKSFLVDNNIRFEEGVISEDNFFASRVYRECKKQRNFHITSIKYNNLTKSVTRPKVKVSYKREMFPLKIWETKSLQHYDHSFKFVLFYWNLWRERANFIEDKNIVEDELVKYFREFIESKNIYKGLSLQYKIAYKRIKKYND